MVHANAPLIFTKRIINNGAKRFLAIAIAGSEPLAWHILIEQYDPDRNQQSKPAEEAQLNKRLKIRIRLRRTFRNSLNQCGHRNLPNCNA